MGASPRGTLALGRAAQALAALRGRDYVLPDDIKELVPATLAHRIILSPEARLRGRTVRNCSMRSWRRSRCRSSRVLRGA